jgi:hypothetical protein
MSTTASPSFTSSTTTHVNVTALVHLVLRRGYNLKLDVITPARRRGPTQAAMPLRQTALPGGTYQVRVRPEQPTCCVQCPSRHR